MKRLFILSHRQARERAAAAVMEAPEGYWVTVREPGKSRDQEEKYHAMLGDIAKQMPLLGMLRDEETVKRLCIDQFWRDTKDDPVLSEYWEGMGEFRNLPSLDGTGVVSIGWQSRKFPKPLASAFVEWLYALGAEGGVKWSDESRSKREEVAA